MMRQELTKTCLELNDMILFKLRSDESKQSEKKNRIKNVFPILVYPVGISLP